MKKRERERRGDEKRGVMHYVISSFSLVRWTSVKSQRSSSIMSGVQSDDLASEESSHLEEREDEEKRKGLASTLNVRDPHCS